MPHFMESRLAQLSPLLRVRTMEDFPPKHGALALTVVSFVRPQLQWHDLLLQAYGDMVRVVDGPPGMNEMGMVKPTMFGLSQCSCVPPRWMPSAVALARVTRTADLLNGIGRVWREALEYYPEQFCSDGLLILRMSQLS